jgi:hypothetical protein
MCYWKDIKYVVRFPCAISLQVAKVPSFVIFIGCTLDNWTRVRLGSERCPEYVTVNHKTLVQFRIGNQIIGHLFCPIHVGSANKLE